MRTEGVWALEIRRWLLFVLLTAGAETRKGHRSRRSAARARVYRGDIRTSIFRVWSSWGVVQGDSTYSWSRRSPGGGRGPASRAGGSPRIYPPRLLWFGRVAVALRGSLARSSHHTAFALGDGGVAPGGRNDRGRLHGDAYGVSASWGHPGGIRRGQPPESTGARERGRLDRAAPARCRGRPRKGTGLLGGEGRPSLFDVRTFAPRLCEQHVLGFRSRGSARR